MTRPPTRRTPQLLLRAPDPSDVDALFAIRGDPAAMQFTWCSPSREATASFLDDYEVTYFIDRSCWGRGLATELVQASLVHAFRDLALPEVGAFVRPENHASVRVLAKAGFARIRFVPELERDAFAIAAKNWDGTS